MNPQRVTCPSCQHSFRLSTETAHVKVKCPSCGGEVEVGARPAAARTPGARPAGSRPADSKGKVKAQGAGKDGGARAGGATAAEARGAHAHREAPPKKSPLPVVLGVGAVAVIGLGFFLFRGSGETPAAAAPAAAAKTYDLSHLADLPPIEGTSDADWEAIKELVKRYTTPPFGPASTQAGDRLMIKGKVSVPAILNGLKGLDLTTKEGADIGWKMQTLLLQGLCKDTNFGWVRETRPQDVIANGRVIERWFEAWKVAGQDDALWEQIAQAKGIPPGLAKSSGDSGEESVAEGK